MPVPLSAIRSSLPHNGPMTGLKQQIRTDLTEAMRAKDRDTLAALRMVLAAISAEEVSGSSARVLTDDEVIAVLVRERKRRQEAALAFTDAGRLELAASEKDEAEVISRYLPTALSDEDLDRLVATAVANAEADGLSGGRALGAVMKELKPATAGKVDGSKLAGLVKQSLGLTKP
jgi:uncharacterized protein YqeY